MYKQFFLSLLFSLFCTNAMPASAAARAQTVTPNEKTCLKTAGVTGVVAFIASLVMDKVDGNAARAVLARTQQLRGEGLSPDAITEQLKKEFADTRWWQTWGWRLTGAVWVLTALLGGGVLWRMMRRGDGLYTQREADRIQAQQAASDAAHERLTAHWPEAGEQFREGDSYWDEPCLAALRAQPTFNSRDAMDAHDYLVGEGRKPHLAHRALMQGRTFDQYAPAMGPNKRAKNAYSKASLRFHPDKTGGVDKYFKSIGAAWGAFEQQQADLHVVRDIIATGR